MAYVTAEARQDLLDAIAQAIEEIGLALADLGGAYELLDDYNADKLEAELFRPVQTAYGRAKRTYTGFAGRYELPGREFPPAEPASAARGVKPLLERALGAIGEADTTLATLQDSMMPVEVGDAELRAGLAEVRDLIGGLRGRSREFVRTLGR